MAAVMPKKATAHTGLDRSSSKKISPMTAILAMAVPREHPRTGGSLGQPCGEASEQEQADEGHGREGGSGHGCIR